jgi:hypothetical protein
MRLCTKYYAVIILFIFASAVYSQQNRIKYNNQDLFLSGTNLAWINFANDVGSGKTDYNTFADVLLQIHDNGGNSLRWWIHTDGTVSPEFDNLGKVTGPGATTIQELKKVLDLAWEREVGVVLCLWAHNMLETNKGAVVLSRNRSLLTDTTYTNAYINNALIPMVDSLKGHPAIIAWEIFNEPEGITNLLTWSEYGKVSITDIQRFVNKCAGAIHREDPNALVTNGSATVGFITDIAAPPLGKVSDELAKYSESEKRDMEENFYHKYGFRQTAEQLITEFQNIAAANYNYYSDDRLIAVGGDPDGKLDFYTFHYYSWMGALSPFTKTAAAWNLDKPTVVGEFHMVASNGVPTNLLYPTIYNNGYAGAWAWSWTDNQVSQKTDILAALKNIWDNHKSDVDVLGIGGDWPTVKLTSPANNTKFPAAAEVTINAEAADADGSISKVEFFANDTLKIGEVATSPYSIVWKGMPNGDYRLKAIATDDKGHSRTSSFVLITIGTPTITKLEAEGAQKQGTGVTVKSDAAASKGNYVDCAAQVWSITWTFTNYLEAGSYEIAFGYRLAYNTPKGQNINVNGNFVTELSFDGPMNVWQEKKMNVDLVKGTNTIQMEASWGWMQVDYLAVPTNVVTGVEQIAGVPENYSLSQNYPNPFNPTTTINYSIPKYGNVKLAVYNLLGEQIAVLVNGFQNAGEYKVEFNANNFASGIYFYRIETGTFSSAKQMMLVK